ncbi:hypothetical protein EES45_16675 [Streptomyces sp. ADI97-07]|uniref:hypothetical protein n=1 Tax=Streptomyces sp. ADI97-07 TaxID=1522762 RepID=UPI000F555BAD|nr:hypothetical protein [Streptomyces sp. ADI97-07]RPK78706.1 hypothetical protein EES45_16675 [Streptomyces sp. ADI97-07]
MTEVDRQLHNKVDQVGNRVLRLTENLIAVSDQVSAVDTAQKQTQDSLLALVTEFRSFVRSAALTANLHSAETQILSVEERLEREYGHLKRVRRTAVGILQAFDVGLATQDTVQQISEELMIESPRYWLAPALVALAAWPRDDRALCDKAVEEAFRRSPERTSLLFALILRRQGRADGAVRWLRHYLRAQNPDALGREFAVILECIAQGAFGPAGRDLMKTTLAGWRETLMTDDEARQAQVRRWRAEIDGLRGPASAQFPRLSRCSPQWPVLDEVLRCAGAHQALLDTYAALPEPDTRLSDRLEDTVDDILDRLVGEYDSEELPYHRELALHRAVVAAGGDRDAAQRATEVGAASYEERSDYLSVQTTAALDPAAIGASAATQRLSVAACGPWIAEAHAGFSRDYRAKAPSEVELHIGDPAGVDAGGRKCRIPVWKGSFNTDVDAMERSLVSHWERRIEPFVQTLAYPLRNPLLLMAGVVVAILLVLSGASVGFALLLALFVGGVWGVVVYQRWDAADTAQDDARELLHRHKREAVDQLRGSAAELADWQQRYRAADAVEGAARTFIASLATTTPAGAPFEGRVVTGSEGGTV